MKRRALLQGLAAALGTTAFDGLVIGIAHAADEPKKYGGDGMPHGLQDSPKVFVAIATDGTVSIVNHRSEMGQGIRTSLPRVVADELEADWSRVKVVQAPGDEPKYGNQDTDGSRSMRHWFEPMRRCGASARQMLEQAAAARWKVPLAEVKAVDHRVVHEASGRSLDYGALAAAAAKLPVPKRESLRLKSPSDFRYIGQSPMLVDAPTMVDGRAEFGIDVKLPGMLHAVIARPRVMAATVKSIDAREALKVPGVVKVFELAGTPPPSEFQPIGGVVVVARDTWAAIKGRQALKIEWSDSPHASYDSTAYRKSLEASVQQRGGAEVRSEGDAYAALAQAAKVVKADYYTPHYAHATMEPPNATARIAKGRCDVWAPTQSPQAAKERIAKRLKLKPEQVNVNVTLLGGGFGRKSKADFVVEAALVSQSMGGKPVKLTWTREDDLHHDYLHAACAQHLEAGLDAQGKVTAWLHRSAEPTLMSIFASDPKQIHPLEAGLGLINLPYAIPNLRIENPPAVAHTRIGWLRSVNNIQHAFATQSFVAEVAAAAGRDHREFLLSLLGPDRKISPTQMKDGWNHGESPERYPLDTARLRGVIEKVTAQAGWGTPRGQGAALGLAAHYSFVSYVGMVIEASVDAKSGQVKVGNVDVVVDCGPVVNPDRVRSQLEGAVINGLSQALMSQITFKAGAVEQDNLHQYELLRMAGAPKAIRITIVESKDYTMPLGGVGEPGVPPVAPALCNALQSATGRRIRTLPIRDAFQSQAA